MDSFCLSVETRCKYGGRLRTMRIIFNVEKYLMCSRCFVHLFIQFGYESAAREKLLKNCRDWQPRLCKGGMTLVNTK